MAIRTIAEICLATDNSRTTPTWTESGIVVVRSKNIKNGRLHLTAQPSYTDEESFAKRTKNVIPRAGDVIITREAPMGEVCIIPPGLRCCMGQRMVLLRPNPDVISPEYLLYSLLAPQAKRQIGIHEGAGSTVSNLRVPMILGLKLNVPSLSEQERTVAILAAIDAKIDMNRKLNERLEAWARAVFTSWFVDYDPVRAKVEKQRPFGMDAETSSLFPDKFEESELGMVPKGWQVETLDAIAKVTMGQSPPGDTYNELGNGLPFYQGSTDFGVRFPTRRIYCSAPTRTAEVGDTLVSVRAPVGDQNVATERCAIGRGVAAVRHRSGSASFTYGLVQSLGAQFRVYDGQGTVFGSIGGSQLRGLKVVSPPSRLIERYTLRAGACDNLQAIHESENDKLAILRDSLIRALMFGEVRVSAAEKLVEGAT